MGAPPLHPDQALIQACIDGARAEQRALMRRLLGVVRAQVRASLRRVGRPGAGAEADDLIQDVLCELLRVECRALRRWDPERGMQLDGFVRLIARRYLGRRVARIVATTAEPIEPDWLEDFGAGSPGAAAETRDEIDAVLAGLELSGKDHEMFERVFLQGERDAEVASALGMSSSAVKKWRSRFRVRAREVRRGLKSVQSQSRRPHEGDGRRPTL